MLDSHLQDLETKMERARYLPPGDDRNKVDKLADDALREIIVLDQCVSTGASIERIYEVEDRVMDLLDKVKKTIKKALNQLEDE